MFATRNGSDVVAAMQSVVNARAWDLSLTPHGFETVTPTGALQLNLITPEDDDFNGTVLGCLQWSHAAKAKSATAIDQLATTEAVIGVVPTPRLPGPADPRFTLVVELAAQLDALLFNGVSFVDSSGHEVLRG